MDGFHLDNRLLDAAGLRSRKGAPDTFDALGFVNMVARLRAGDAVAIPIFDRAADLSRAGADIVERSDRVLLIEGNYLLLDEPPWTGARYDLTVAIDVPEVELQRRLVQRWLDQGMPPGLAAERALSNDIPNGRRVLTGSRPAEIVVAAR